MRHSVSLFPLNKKIPGTELVPVAFVKLPKEKGGNTALELICSCGRKTIKTLSELVCRKVTSCRECAWKRRGRNRRFSYERFILEFNKKFTKSSYCKCWEWIASKNRDGYGTVSFNGKVMTSHRVAWIVNNGKIPLSTNVLHRCDNPSCVNPEHLFLGTQGDNIRDCVQKGRFTRSDRRGEKSAISPFKNGDILSIRQEAANGKSRSQIARERNCSRTSIDSIVNRKTWTHI